MCQELLPAEDFKNRITEATLQNANHSLATKIGWPGCSLLWRTYLESWKKDLWRDQEWWKVCGGSTSTASLAFIDDVNCEVSYLLKLKQKLPLLTTMIPNILLTVIHLNILNSLQHTCHILKGKLKATNHWNKQELKRAAVQAWHSITREDTQHLVMSMGHRH